MSPDLVPPGITWHSSPNNLSVTDVERLAKAGIAITWNDISHSVLPDYMMQPPPTPTSYEQALTDPIRERWRRANQHKAGRFDVNPTASVHLSAVEYGEDIYVFVATGRGEPQILTDKSCLYPSDALMAQIHLLVEAQK